MTITSPPRSSSTVRGAYDVLVSMSIISYFIPYLFIFALLVKLLQEPAGPTVMRVPGGERVAWVVSSVGFLTPALSIGGGPYPCGG